MEQVTVKDLGRAKNVTSTREETIILGGKGDKMEIAALIAQVEDAERKATLSNTMAEIKVGALTEGTRETKKKKIENAINSTQLAYQSGGVRGSGLSLASLKTSSHILNTALQYPHSQFRENLGLDEIDFKEDEAYNAITEKKGDFMEVGVIDPLITIQSELEIAVEKACDLITSCSMIVKK